jgi:hypothetical protein
MQEIPITTAIKQATTLQESYPSCSCFDLVADLLQAHYHFINMFENIQMSNLLQSFTNAHKTT